MPKVSSLNDSGSQSLLRDKRLASIAESALYASVHPDTIRRRISGGQLTGYRFGGRIIRVDLNEVDALLRPIPTYRPVA